MHVTKQGNVVLEDGWGEGFSVLDDIADVKEWADRVAQNGTQADALIAATVAAMLGFDLEVWLDI